MIFVKFKVTDDFLAYLQEQGEGVHRSVVSSVAGAIGRSCPVGLTISADHAFQADKPRVGLLVGQFMLCFQERVLCEGALDVAVRESFSAKVMEILTKYGLNILIESVEVSQRSAAGDRVLTVESIRVLENDVEMASQVQELSKAFANFGGFGGTPRAPASATPPTPTPTPTPVPAGGFFNNDDAHLVAGVPRPTESFDLVAFLSKYHALDAFYGVLGKVLRTLAANNMVDKIRALFAQSQFDVTRYVDYQDTNPASKKTALHHAVGRGHTSVVGCLKSAGASLTIADASGMLSGGVAAPAVSVGGSGTGAAGAGDVASFNLVELLGECSALDAFYEVLGKVLRGMAHNNQLADMNRLFAQPQFVIGRYIDSQGPTNKKTALHLALENMHVDIMGRLMMSGADITIADASGRTPTTLLESVNVPGSGLSYGSRRPSR